MGINEDKNIEKLYTITDNLNNRVTELEKRTAVSETQVNMIFKILEEIKTSVSDIATEIKNLKEKPSIMMSSIGSGVIVGTIIVVATKLLG